MNKLRELYTSYKALCAEYDVQYKQWLDMPKGDVGQVVVRNTTCTELKKQRDEAHECLLQEVERMIYA